MTQNEAIESIMIYEMPNIMLLKTLRFQEREKATFNEYI